MATIINLDEVRVRFSTRKDGEPWACQSPIVIGRSSRYTATIGFRKDCFTVEFIDPVARGALRGDRHWKLYLVEESFSAEHVTYMIQVDNNFDDEAVAATMEAKLGLIAKKVYVAETRTSPKRVAVADLTRPPKYPEDTRLVIMKATSDCLMRAGMKTAADLTLKTRSEICAIPGMSTHEVYKLEKSLAARHLFLLSDDVPEWIGG